MLKLKKDLTIGNINESYDHITVNNIQLIDLKKGNAFEVLRKTGMMRNSEIVIPKDFRLENTEEIGGAIEYTFERLDIIIKVDLVDIEEELDRILISK